MTRTSLSVILRSQPALQRDLDAYLPLNLVQESLDERVYVWCPNYNRGESFLRITEPLRALRVSIDEDVRGTGLRGTPMHYEIREAKKRGVKVPAYLTRKARTLRTFLQADEALFKLLQNRPDLERELAKYNPFWEIVKFTGGKPTYNSWTSISFASDNGVENVAYRLAQFMAVKYKGLVWDSENKRLGRISSEKPDETKDITFKYFLEYFHSLIGGWTWKPVS